MRFPHFVLILLLLPFGVVGQDTLISHARSNITEMFSREDVCEEIFQLMEERTPITDNLLLGYYGAAHFCLSRHVGNPFKKLSHFKEGKSLLEESILNDSTNVELRFLRLSMQVNAPGFLDYDEHMQADKAFIEKNLAEIPNNLKKRYYALKNEAEKEGKL